MKDNEKRTKSNARKCIDFIQWLPRCNKLPGQRVSTCVGVCVRAFVCAILSSRGVCLCCPLEQIFFSDFRYLFHSFCKRKYSNFGLRTSFPDRVKYFYTTVGYFFNMSFHEDALNRFFLHEFNHLWLCFCKTIFGFRKTAH